MSEGIYGIKWSHHDTITTYVWIILFEIINAAAALPLVSKQRRNWRTLDERLIDLNKNRVRE